MQDPGAAEVSAALDRIFARPEFTEREAPALLRALGDAIRAFREWLLSLLPHVLPERWHPIFTVILAAAFAVIAVWLLVRIIEGREGARDGAGDTPARSRWQPQGGPDAAWWEAAAGTAAAEGRYRDAASALYMAAVLRLAERGVVRFQAGKTPGEYRREARRDASVRGAFDALVREYLPVAFARAVPDAGSLAALRLHAKELGVNA